MLARRGSEPWIQNLTVRNAISIPQQMHRQWNSEQTAHHAAMPSPIQSCRLPLLYHKHRAKLCSARNVDSRTWKTTSDVRAAGLSFTTPHSRNMSSRMTTRWRADPIQECASVIGILLGGLLAYPMYRHSPRNSGAGTGNQRSEVCQASSRSQG